MEVARKEENFWLPTSNSDEGDDGILLQFPKYLVYWIQIYYFIYYYLIMKIYWKMYTITSSRNIILFSAMSNEIF